MTATSYHVVLVVDDAEDCRTTLGIAIEALPGVVIRSAANAEDGLALLERENVDAVITDLHLPAMTGLELIARIRGQDRFRSLPILAVSAATDPATPKAALASGANAFFPKPFSPVAVRRKLEELIYGS
ncbi:MAG TPA: response regulator [Bryobacteraceae bacterium]